MSDKELRDFHDAAQPQTFGLLPFDAADYMQYLDNEPLTAEQKIDFLQALWAIMAGFVNYGWGVDSVIPLLVQKATQTHADALERSIATQELNVTAETVLAARKDELE
jgi:hypothetical protein